jgi:predicted nuclease of predicted toxin-antitoxin system
VAKLTIFFDRCFGTSLPKWLRDFETPFDVEFHDDPKHGFNQKTPDDEWIAQAGAKNWILLSHDKRFHQDSMAVAAVKQFKVACFYLDGGALPAWDKTILFGRRYTRMKHIFNSEKRPFIYRIHHRGDVRRITSDWAP